MAHTVSAQQVAHRLQAIELFAAALAARDMRLDHRGVRRVELAIDEPAEQQFLINAGGHHFALLDWSLSALAGGSSSFASIARARDRRDMTVPTGTPVTSAISA